MTACGWAGAEPGGWRGAAEAGHPDRGPPPAAARGQEHGLPEVQPPGPVPVHALCAPGHALRPAQRAGAILVYTLAGPSGCKSSFASKSAVRLLAPGSCGKPPSPGTVPGAAAATCALLLMTPPLAHLRCRGARGRAWRRCTTGATRAWATCPTCWRGPSTRAPTRAWPWISSLWTCRTTRAAGRARPCPTSTRCGRHAFPGYSSGGAVINAADACRGLTPHMVQRHAC